MPFHRDYTGSADVHVPISFTYANTAARTGAAGFTSADLYKFAVQTDDDSVWMLTATTPTWQQLGGSGGIPPALANASFITRISESSLSNETAMGALATGLVKNAVTTGVPSIATPGVDYLSAAGVPWVNAMDPAYGAVGNGSTDDTTAINNAIAAAATGGVVFLPPGHTFATTDSIKINKSIAFVMRGSILHRTGTTATPIVLVGNDDFSRLNRVTMIGVRVEKDSLDWTDSIIGIKFRNTCYVYGEEFETRNCKTGIEWSGEGDQCLYHNIGLKHTIDHLIPLHVTHDATGGVNEINVFGGNVDYSSTGFTMTGTILLWCDPQGHTANISSIRFYGTCFQSTNSTTVLAKIDGGNGINLIGARAETSDHTDMALTIASAANTGECFFTFTGEADDFALTDNPGTSLVWHLGRRFIGNPLLVGNMQATALIAAGLTGATAASRYVGATASGAPVSGTFAVGDFVIDQGGNIWVCTAAGSPGTWTAPSGTGAPTTAHYVTTQAEGALSNEFSLGSLTTGILKHSVSGNVSTPATASLGTDYAGAPDGTTLETSSSQTRIKDAGVSNAKLANMANKTYKGRHTSGTGVPEDVSAANVYADIGVAGYNDVGNSSTAQTIDWSLAHTQKSTLTGSVTYTFSNPTVGDVYVLQVIQGSGPYTVTWPEAVKWPGGTAPTLSTTNGHVDIFTFLYDGTDFFGVTSGQNYTP